MGYRSIGDVVGADRKTVRRYIEAAQRCGLTRGSDSEAIDDGLVAEVISMVSPGAPARYGTMRQFCGEHEALIEGWVRQGCKTPKIARLLHRHTGVEVPDRTLGRFIAEDLADAKKAGATVRIVDPPPGQILEVDFMEVGKVVFDGVEQKLHALICVASRSRHTFLWPCLSQSREAVIDGLDAAWAFYGGVFPVVVIDNPRTVVLVADPLGGTLAEDVVEYSQARGFVIDLARVRHPRDKARVERTVSYARNDGFGGEKLLDLEQTRRLAEHWCREVAGCRRHGTIRRQPLAVFLEEEQALLLAAPEESWDPPTWVDLRVGDDHAVRVEYALYSVPYALRGKKLRIRVDRKTVKMYDRGALVKVHPRVPEGEAKIDPDDLPPGKAELATRDAEGLRERAARHGEAIGEYASRLLEGELPWTRIRHVYRLLGLCKRFGDARVDQACRQALDLDVVEVKRIDRMLTRSLETHPLQPPPRGQVISLRFGRQASEYRVSNPQSEESSDAT